MRTSLSTRAAAASAAAALFLSPGLEAAFARSQTSFRAPLLRAGFVRNHAQAPGWRNGIPQSWNWRGRYGGTRSSGDGWFWNAGGFYGDGFSYAPYGYAEPAGGGGTIVVVGAPALSVFPGAAPGAADPTPEGGCMIHRLIYDSSGKYVGERVTSEC